MKSELLARSPMLLLPLGALFFFLFVFLVVLVTTMRRRPDESLTSLPLDDAEHPDKRIQ